MPKLATGNSHRLSDSKKFSVRSKAQAEPASFGELVLDDLKKAYKQESSLEARQRLDVLVKQARKSALPYGTLGSVRVHRTLEVLERIGNTEAKQLLREYAEGAPAAQITVAARAVVSRSSVMTVK